MPTEPPREEDQNMQSLKLLTKIGSPADRLKAERLIRTARDAREDFDTFQQERLQSTSLTTSCS